MHPNQAAPAVGDDLLTEGEAARLRRQSVRTLQAERLRGDGCAYVKLGRSVRYRRADVLSFIEGNLRKATEPADEVSSERPPNSDLSSEPLPNATGPRPLLESANRDFLRNQCTHVVRRYAAFSKQSPFAALVALKAMARELSEADLRDLDCRAAI
jgi:hypothetical protein